MRGGLTRRVTGREAHTSVDGGSRGTRLTRTGTDRGHGPPGTGPQTGAGVRSVGTDW